MRLLAVDDDKIVLELLAEALSLNEFEDVTTVSSGEEALRIIDTTSDPFDGFLLDVQMPTMDGIELTRRIRKMRGYRRTPIIMVTAMEDKGHVNAAFLNGANDYITKPFDVFELGIRLRNNLEIANSRARSLKISNFQEARIPEPMLEGVVSRVTIVNYLTQLGRCHAEHSVVAFKMSNIKDLEQKLSTTKIENRLHFMALAISNHLSDYTFLCSYVSHGTFLCVVQSKAAVLDEFFASGLEDAINVFDRLGGTTLHPSKVVMSPVVRCRKYQQINASKVIGEVLNPFEADVLPSSRRPQDISAEEVVHERIN